MELLKRKMLRLVTEQTAVFIQTAGRLSQKSRMKVKWWHITNIIIIPCRDRKTCHFLGGGGVGGILCNISCDVHNEFTSFFFITLQMMVKLPKFPRGFCSDQHTEAV